MGNEIAFAHICGCGMAHLTHAATHNNCQLGSRSAIAHRPQQLSLSHTQDSFCSKLSVNRCAVTSRVARQSSSCRSVALRPELEHLCLPVRQGTIAQARNAASEFGVLRPQQLGLHLPSKRAQLNSGLLRDHLCRARLERR
eukprot:3564200-Prymnesium_polylepis.2